MGPYVAVAVLTLALMVGNALWPNRRKRIDRALAARPSSRVRDAQGTVRLTGRVRRIGEPLSSPLSGRPCVAFELIVDEPSLFKGPGMAEWRRMVTLTEARPFWLVDESGEARIDTDGPFEMALVADLAATTSGPHPGKHPQLASFLSSLGVTAMGWFGRWGRFRYAEGVLEDGALVTVSAESVFEVDPTGEREDPRSPPRRLVLRGSGERPLLISSTTKDVVRGEA